MWIGKRSADHQHETTKQTICVFEKDSSMIICHGNDGEDKECKVEYKFEEPEFQLYGIGISETEPIDEKYRLIPRKTDNSVWLKDFKMVDGKEKHYSLYHKEEMHDFGLRVVDQKCFKELVDLLKMSTRKEKVFISSDKHDQTAIIIGNFLSFYLQFFL